MSEPRTMQELIDELHRVRRENATLREHADGVNRRYLQLQRIVAEAEGVLRPLVGLLQGQDVYEVVRAFRILKTANELAAKCESGLEI